MLYHQNQRVNELVEFLLQRDFFQSESPYRPKQSDLPPPLTFGQTLLAVADRFGEEIATSLNLRKH